MLTQSEALALHDGEQLLSNAYGLADIENNVPLETRHLFRGETVNYTRSADGIESIQFADMTAYPIERVEFMIAGLDRVRPGTW